MSIVEGRLEAVAFEARYWQALLDDLREANRALEPVAEGLAEASVALISLVPIAGPRAHGFVMDGLDAVNRALRSAQDVSTRIESIVALALGRGEVLKTAIAAARAEMGEDL